MEQHEEFLSVLQQRHRLPNTPVRQYIIDAVGMYDARMDWFFEPESSTFHLCVGAMSRAAIPWATAQSPGLGELGWAWHPDDGVVAVWRPACGYAIDSRGADDAQPWRMARSDVEAYAMIVVNALRQDYPELAYNEYMHAMTNTARHAAVIDIRHQVQHRNVRQTYCPDEPRNYYDPHAGVIREALAMRYTRSWVTRGFRIHPHMQHRSMMVEPLSVSWAVHSIQPWMYIVAMSHTDQAYDIRFGASVPEVFRAEILHRRGRVPKPETFHQQMTLAANTSALHSMTRLHSNTPKGMFTRYDRAWLIDERLGHYEMSRCPDWLEDRDNLVLGLKHMDRW